MKITDKRTEKKEYTFKDVVLGNVFEYSGDIYLKLDTSDADNNAYNLNTCRFTTLSDGTVMPIEAELVIRDTKNMTGQNDKTELIGGIIDIFEDFLDDISGSDYDSISDSLESLLRSWKVIE